MFPYVEGFTVPFAPILVKTRGMNLDFRGILMIGIEDLVLRKS